MAVACLVCYDSIVPRNDFTTVTGSKRLVISILEDDTTCARCQSRWASYLLDT